MRKAIYELLRHQGIPKKAKDGNLIDYDERIRQLKTKLPSVDSGYFDILKMIKGLTSEELHEDSWQDFDNLTLRLLIETTKEILYSIYVEPNEKTTRKSVIQKLHDTVLGSRKGKESVAVEPGA